MHPHVARRALLLLAAVHGLYYVGAGLWPVLHLGSFLAVTGPKTDVWLVQTVGVLVAVVGAVLLLAALRRDVPPEVRLLGAASAAAFLAVDVYFFGTGRIGAVYLLDAAAEAALLGAWAYLSAASGTVRWWRRPRPT